MKPVSVFVRVAWKQRFLHPSAFGAMLVETKH